MGGENSTNVRALAEEKRSSDAIADHFTAKILGNFALISSFELGEVKGSRGRWNSIQWAEDFVDNARVFIVADGRADEDLRDILR
eukprot:CAMPEP_0181302650 /NCGR_PEP_ID=MMETSP1101-20121128/8113_1 /TAXON_ID=46948 /ORGANISM="Rhodomonas abbreviata, Strain Caron Lab Isolate" /LENGTH=84 /DNA_ID=CAMNT_0023408121 /DNA_START=482 /DNA_END=737 /DNA_ORIENTATION=+